jgi:serine/threonine protein kinase
MLHRGFSSDPEVAQRFHREAKAASRLNHANSIAVLDFGQAEDGTLFMAMEYLAGRDLARVIAEEFPLPEARIVRIGAQILSALGEAHARGIIHRDLKPENVMIERRRDEPDFVKVLDFGIAKITAGADEPKLTAIGLVCGTPEYMSPEQARGEKLDARSDLYALGIVLFELFTGDVPFHGDTPIATIFKHVQDPPPLDGPRGARLPRAIVPVVAKALSKSREDRFGSAVELADALRQARAATFPEMGETPQPFPTIAGTSALPRPVAAMPTPTPAPTPIPHSTPAPMPTAGHKAPPPAARVPVRRPAPPRPTLPWLAAPILLIVVGIVVAAFLLFRPNPVTPSPSPQPTAGAATSPSPASSPLEVTGTAVAGPGIAASPTPSLAGPSPRVQEPSPTPVATRPSPSPSGRRVEVVPPPPPSPTVEAKGSLQLLVRPWGEVSVDGVNVGTTPLRPVTLTAGVHQVRLAHPDYQAVQRKVMIRPGETTRLEVDFSSDSSPK